MKIRSPQPPGPHDLSKAFRELKKLRAAVVKAEAACELHRKQPRDTRATEKNDRNIDK
jgi:hypothetical protein